jgi:hypothetical protein
MDLSKQLESVSNRESFLAFARALAQDRRLMDAYSDPDWRNDTIVDYLEAAIAWAEGRAGQPDVLPEEPSWRALAAFLHAGKLHE